MCCVLFCFLIENQKSRRPIRNEMGFLLRPIIFFLLFFFFFAPFAGPSGVCRVAKAGRPCAGLSLAGPGPHGRTPPQDATPRRRGQRAERTEAGGKRTGPRFRPPHSPPDTPRPCRTPRWRAAPPHPEAEGAAAVGGQGQRGRDGSAGRSSSLPAFGLSVGAFVLRRGAWREGGTRERKGKGGGSSQGAAERERRKRRAGSKSGGLAEGGLGTRDSDPTSLMVRFIFRTGIQRLS